MTKEQFDAAKSLKRALKKCAAASLGVYIYEGGVGICPQPEGREHPEWNHRPLTAVAELGEEFNIDNLDCDGGAGC